MASMSQAEAAQLLKSEEVSKVIFFKNNYLIVKNALNFSQKLLIFLESFQEQRIRNKMRGESGSAGTEMSTFLTNTTWAGIFTSFL